jgi:bifunctional non-homologous end joining protein LigD
MKQISLYYREGSSDKEYHVSMESRDDKFVVNIAYGRRGSTLQTGTKTNSPVDLQTAGRLFDKLVSEKKSKGYTEGESGTPYQHTEKEERVTGLLPQLLNPIEESDLEELISDNHWCAQEKFDGKRLLIERKGAAVNGINRKGLLVGLPSTLIHASQALKGDFVIDGECIGEAFRVFDLLTCNGDDFRGHGYEQRFVGLMNLIAGGQQRHIQLADTAWKRHEKTNLLKTLRQQNKEGIVFKRVDALYTPGRPNSGGDQLKHKFYATCSAVVAKLNAQRSVELRLLNGEGWLPAGNVTVPSNHQLPQVGDVIEVRYLYAFRESGALYQPTYLGRRSDVAQHDCGQSQLKFKGEEA